jgi:hypothetical protein
MPRLLKLRRLASEEGRLQRNLIGERLPERHGQEAGEVTVLVSACRCRRQGETFLPAMQGGNTEAVFPHSGRYSTPVV